MSDPGLMDFSDFLDFDAGKTGKSLLNNSYIKDDYAYKGDHKGRPYHAIFS